MNPHTQNFMLPTDRLELFYRKELTEEKIMKTKGAFLGYLISLIMIGVGIFTMLIRSLLQVFLHSDNSENIESFLIVVLTGLLFLIVGFLVKNYMIIKYSLNKFTAYKSSIRNLFSYKNAEMLLQLHRYEKLTTELQKNEYKHVETHQLKTYFANKSDVLSKRKLGPIAITALLLLSVWSSLSSVFIGTSDFLASQKLEMAIVFCGIAIALSILVFLFQKWYANVFMSYPKTIGRLVELLEAIEINEKKSSLQSWPSSKNRYRYRT